MIFLLFSIYGPKFPTIIIFLQNSHLIKSEINANIANSLIKSNKKTMSANTALKRKKQYDVIYDELTLKKLMQYYRFEKREELLNFLSAVYTIAHSSLQ